MTVMSFIESPCEAFCPQDDAGEPLTGGDAPTWGDWLKDVLVTMTERGEGFDGKRPNCDTDWSHYLRLALRKHEVTMAEVVATVFDIGRWPGYRTHAPGPRTRAALDIFRSLVAGREPASESLYACELAESACKMGAVPVCVDKEHAEAALAWLRRLEAEDGNGSGIALGYGDRRLVRTYVEEMMLGRWRRGDSYASHSP